MYKHIVVWSFKEGNSKEENAAIAARAKSDLEGLKDLIPGILELKVYTELLDCGDPGVILESVFESEEALRNYYPHPEHQRAAQFVRSAFADRKCIDYKM